MGHDSGPFNGIRYLKNRHRTRSRFLDWDFIYLTKIKQWKFPVPTRTLCHMSIIMVFFGSRVYVKKQIRTRSLVLRFWCRFQIQLNNKNNNIYVEPCYTPVSLELGLRRHRLKGKLMECALWRAEWRFLSH